MKKRFALFLLPLLVLSIFVNLLGCGGDDGDISNSITLYFVCNNGDFWEPKTYKSAQDIILPNEPTKQGYEFGGWFVDQDFAVPFDTSLASDGMTLYAKWDVLRLKVTYIYYDDKTTEDIVLYGEKLELLPTDTARAGYVFFGWYEDQEYLTVFDNTKPITQNLCLYAKWNQILHTISIVDWDQTPLFECKVQQASTLGVDNLESILQIPMLALDEFVGFYIGAEPVDIFTYEVFSDQQIQIKYNFSASDLSFFEFEATKDGYLVGASASATGQIFLPPSYNGKLVVGTKHAQAKEQGAFFQSKITSVYIPSSFVSLAAYSFFDSAITAIELNEGIVSIGESAFEDCDKLIDIELKNSITSIGANAFKLCESLTTVTITEQSELKTIGEYAFSDCSMLKEIFIPPKARLASGVGGAARIFSRCIALSSVRASVNSPYYYSIDGVLHSSDKTLLIYYPAGKKDTLYQLEDTLTEIGDYAIYNNQYCKEFLLADGLTSIGDYAFAYSAIQSISFPSSLKSIGVSAFWYVEKLQTVTFEPNSQLTTLGEFSFYGCSSLVSFTITALVPPTYDGVECNAFSYSSIPAIYVPQESVEHYKQIWTAYKGSINGI